MTYKEAFESLMQIPLDVQITHILDHAEQKGLLWDWNRNQCFYDLVEIEKKFGFIFVRALLIECLIDNVEFAVESINEALKAKKSFYSNLMRKYNKFLRGEQV